MQGAQFKTRYMVVRPQNHCSDLDKPPAHLACVLKSTPRRLISRSLKFWSSHLSQCTNRPRPPSTILNHLRSPPELRIGVLQHLQGLRWWSLSQLLELRSWPEP
ncbi:hypothetical protein VULLAG_LOCUS4381 [Vulpes lagopus]